MEYYSAVKRHGAVTQATVWTHLTDVSRGSQSRKAPWYDSICGKYPEKAKPKPETESGWRVPGAGAMTAWGVTADECRVPVRGEENDLGLEVVATRPRVCSAPRNRMFDKW